MLIGSNTFVVGSVVAFPADVFVWLPSGVTLVGANTFVVGSVAEWLGIRLVIWRSGFNSQLSHIFTSPRTADVFPVVCGSQPISSLISLVVFISVPS